MLSCNYSVLLCSTEQQGYGNISYSPGNLTVMSNSNTGITGRFWSITKIGFGIYGSVKKRMGIYVGITITKLNVLMITIIGCHMMYCFGRVFYLVIYMALRIILFYVKALSIAFTITLITISSMIFLIYYFPTIIWISYLIFTLLHAWFITSYLNLYHYQVLHYHSALLIMSV